jgi:hypothetical protein
MNAQTTQHAQALVSQWRGDFAAAMQAMGDFLPELEVESAPPVRDPAMLWWNQPLDVAAGASIWVGTAEETWTDLGRRILAAAGVEEFSPAELKDTYLEVLRQSLGVLATAVGGKLGREVTTTTGSEEAPSSEPVFGCHVSIRVSGQKLPSLVFYISHEMLDAFENCRFSGGGVGAGRRSRFRGSRQPNPPLRPRLWNPRPAARCRNAGQRFFRAHSGAGPGNPEVDYRVHHRTGPRYRRAGGSHRQ